MILKTAWLLAMLGWLACELRLLMVLMRLGLEPAIPRPPGVSQRLIIRAYGLAVIGVMLSQLGKCVF